MTPVELSTTLQLIGAAVAFGVWQRSIAAGVCFYLAVASYSAIRNARR